MDELKSLIEKNGSLWTEIFEAGDKAFPSTQCKRGKKVVASVFCLRDRRVLYRTMNGPMISSFFCTNEIGNCGCAHAELKAASWVMQNEAISSSSLVVLCTFSPCRPCANAILLAQRFVACIYQVETDYPDGKEILGGAALPVLELATCEHNDRVEN